MHKKFLLLVTTLAALLLAGCTNPILPGEAPGTDNNATGTVRFSWAAPEQAAARSRATLQDADKVVITIEAADGTVVYDRKQLNLFNFNGSFISEPLALKVGNYRLTDYLILDSTGTVIYAAPKAGSNQAHLVTTPLPLDFTVTKNGTTKIKPEVVNTESVDTTPADYGYWTFQFSEVKIFNMLTSVMSYDASTDSFMPTAAVLDVTTDTKSYSFNLIAGTNKITLNDVTGNYTLIVKKGGYRDYRATFSNTEMKGLFQSPLLVTLQKIQPPANGVLTFSDPAFEAEIRTAIGEPTADITTANTATLTGINIYNKPLADLKGIEHLTALKHVNFVNCGLNDISALANLPELESVNVSLNDLTDLSPLAGLTQLRLLQVGGNKNLSDLTPLAGLTNLTTVNLNESNISDITPLAGLTKLVELYLSDNKISDPGPLAGMVKLRRINFTRNMISDLSPLANLPELAYVNLDSNTVSDISPLQTLPALYEAFLRNNSVTDLTPLVNNTAFTTNDRLYITGNPLSADAQSVQIPALQAKGVNVTF